MPLRTAPPSVPQSPWSCGPNRYNALVLDGRTDVGAGGPSPHRIGGRANRVLPYHRGAIIVIMQVGVENRRQYWVLSKGEPVRPSIAGAGAPASLYQTYLPSIIPAYSMDRTVV